MSKRVLVAMSGGIDSSLAAALLVEAGYDVIGATMQIWSPDLPYTDSDKVGGCCSLSAVDDARRIADALGIPYYVLNLYDLFTREVVDYFAREYERGRTPNPCIRCNRVIKWEALLRRAEQLEADYLATGHYARIEHDDVSGRWLLMRSVDTRKDQTYALYTLTQYQLSKTIFPLGGLTKDVAREMARDRGLPVADKPDSQEICFIPDNNYRRFLNEYAPKATVSGDIVDESGSVLGRHTGIGGYTVGQRKGLGSSIGPGLFVKSVNPQSNIVVVAPHERIFDSSLIAEDVNFISCQTPPIGLKVQAKIRYSAPPATATVTALEGGRVEVLFDQPVRAITPGQAVVFYDGDVVVGGGTITTQGIDNRDDEKEIRR